MYSKFFTRLFLLMGMIGLFSAPLEAEEIQIGSGTGKQYYLPSYSYYMYSLTQQLYTAEELGGIAGTINSIAFYNDGTTQTRNFDIYMVNTNKTSFSSRTDWVSVTASDLVFSGNVTMTKGTWTTITFTTPFDYDGTNIAIMVDDNTNSASSSGSHAQYLTFDVSSYQSIFIYSDGTNYNPFNPPTTGSSTSYKYNTYKNQIKLDIVTAPVTCVKPSGLEATNISAYTATLDWTKGSEDQDTWEIYLTDNANDIPNDESEATISENVTKPYNLSGLTPSTNYYAYVRANCGDTDGKSKWSAGCHFATTCVAIETFPFTETFDDLTTNGEIPMCWNNEEGTTTNENYRWCYNSSYGTGYSGKCVRFDSYSNNSGNTNFLKTPVMSLPQNPAMQLRFWYKNPKGGDFSVYISTDGGQTHETALATGMTNIADWTEKTIDLSDYKGEDNVVIVFKGTSNYGSNDARIYLDDVNIELAPTCPKQNALHVTELTSSSVTLDWTAGNSEQDHWDLFVTTDASITPDANTIPTVTNTNQKPYTHTGLSDETVYFAFVRARCSDTDQSDWTDACRFVTPQIPVVVDGEHPYENDFENTCGWLFVNGDRTNQWHYGSAANNTQNGEKAIYISNDGGTSNTYTNTKGVVYATKAFSFAEGVYTFMYDWRAKGNQYYDYIRVALVPASVEIVATENLPTGMSDSGLPTGWIALDGGSKLNNSDTWNTKIADEISVPAGEYKMVVVWRNLTYAVTQPPAAIDNISISLMNCPRPTALTASNITGRTATLTWTENGTATNWVLQYATNNTFSENLTQVSVSGTASKDLTGLTPETKYYTRVKSVLGNEESLWSDVKDFTTTATCERPTLNYVYYSNTAHSGTVEWTGSANGYEVAYRPTGDFDPSDETLQDVTRVQLGSVNTYILQNLTPETKYYIYVQADCGAEDGKSAWSNRVIFTTLATCLEPSGLQTSATSSTITLSWTAGAQGQDAWDIRYKKNTDSEYTYIHLDNHPVTNYTITGLNPVTTYAVNVRAWCDENDQSKWGASVNQSYDKSVTTECGAINLPYTCDFEGTTQTVTGCKIPQCWSVIRGYYNSTYSYGIPTIANQSSSTQPIAYPHGGSYCLYFLNSTYSGTSEEYAILPEVSQEYKMNDVQIRFWVRSNNTSCQMEVGVMTDPTNASTYVKVEDVEMTNTYTEKTVSLNNYSGNGRYIALKCPAASMYSQAFYVDDITVEYIPSCLVPDNLYVDDIEAFEATLTWTPRGEETAWNVQYKKATDSEWSSPIAVDDTTYTLTGLQRATEYKARVQANCATDDQSDWTNPVSFTTECGIWAIDAQNALMEDFNGETFPPDCWQKVNFNEMGSTNGWLQSFNNPLDNQGAASSDFKYETWLFLPAMHLNGDAFLTFDHLFGSGDVYIPSSVMITTDTDIDLEDIKTEGFIAQHFTSIWTADASNLPSTRRNEVVSLSSYNDDTVYIAFRYEGTYNYLGRIWYIDNVEVYVNATQTTQLAEGWNWWSSYIEMDGVDGLDMLKESLNGHGLQIKSRSDGYTDYEDGEWFGNLDDAQMTNEQMYMILTSTACSVNMEGKAANTENHVITINPNWNWIGFPCSQATSVEKALSGFNPEEGDQIKSFNHYLDFEDGEWFGDLETMTPGLGFMYYSNSTESKNLVYQSSGAKASRATTDNIERHWTPIAVGNYTMTCTSVLVINGEEQSDPQLEIGVFSNDGVCRGAALPRYKASSNRYIYSITIYGEAGYTYTCKVYDHATEQELALTFVPNQDDPLVYEADHRYGTPSNPYQVTFATVTSAFTKNIIAYTEGQKDHYYLIASPIGEVNPTNVTNMLENSYDLYYFDQSAADGLEWINYENPDNDFTTLAAKKGYLYANSGDGNSNVTTLTFAGTPYNGDGTVSLDYDANAQFAGWNLIGNPFGTEASLNLPFYRMNGDGTGLSAQVEANSIVGVMEGVFVKATEPEQSAIFTTLGNGDCMAPVLNINVGRNRGTSVDNAIIRFDEGCQLPKFQLNSNHTKLFIPQGENSFAVVRSASEGEMPVNFKAESNGTYTINFNAENVKMNYLHLIDNLTGANVDLLVNPSYTFEAKTTDYASRFKLVFACGDASDDNETFAYYNGSEWVISNMGEATLQVVDVMGRVLSTETVNGNATMHMNQTLGVYMLRLVNGDSVKVQKVVVR